MRRTMAYVRLRVRSIWCGNHCVEFPMGLLCLWGNSDVMLFVDVMGLMIEGKEMVAISASPVSF